MVKNAIFCSFSFPRYCRNKQWARWEIKQSFDGQLYQEYSYQSLLKLDHFSSSYDQKILVCFMSHSVVGHNCPQFASFASSCKQGFRHCFCFCVLAVASLAQLSCLRSCVVLDGSQALTYPAVFVNRNVTSRSFASRNNKFFSYAC